MHGEKLGGRLMCRSAGSSQWPRHPPSVRLDYGLFHDRVSLFQHYIHLNQRPLGVALLSIALENMGLGEILGRMLLDLRERLCSILWLVKHHADMSRMNSRNGK